MAVERLDREYATQPVVFLEYAVDDFSLYPRTDRWWDAHNGSNARLPLVMVDSGYQITSGDENFYSAYKAMVDVSLARDAQAEIIASTERVGDKVHFEVQATNRSDIVLGSSNDATIWAIVYEEFDTYGAGRLTDRFVRVVVSKGVSTNLMPGATGTYELETSNLSGVNWANLRAVVLIEYRGASGAYDMLQAVMTSVDS